MRSLADLGPVVAGRPAGQEPEGRARRAALEDLEHYDEPSPEDRAELDDMVWRHIDSLLVGVGELECPDDGPEDEVEPGEDDPADEFRDEDAERMDEADRLEDARIEDEDEDEDEEPPDLGEDEPGPVLPGTPADVGLFPPPEPEPEPDLPAGPLAGALRQLAFPIGAGTFGATRRAGRDRSRPGDAPGWKGGIH